MCAGNVSSIEGIIMKIIKGLVIDKYVGVVIVIVIDDNRSW